MPEEKKQEYCPFKREYPAGDYEIAKSKLEARRDDIYSKIFKDAMAYIGEKYLDQLDTCAVNCAVYDFLKEVL